MPTQEAAPPVPPPTGKVVTHIGTWWIVERNGRLTASTRLIKSELDHIAGLHLECVPGGRLEYVPVALVLNRTMRAIWVDDTGDVFTVRLNNQRASGRAAADLSQLLLKTEKWSQGQPWTVQMSTNSETGPFSDMPMHGFGRMRAYMLANCKS